MCLLSSVRCSCLVLAEGGSGFSLQQQLFPVRAALFRGYETSDRVITHPTKRMASCKEYKTYGLIFSPTSSQTPTLNSILNWKNLYLFCSHVSFPKGSISASTSGAYMVGGNAYSSEVDTIITSIIRLV